MANFVLNAQAREEAQQGKGSSRRLRRLEGLVPAIVYGGKNKPTSIQLAHKDLKRALEEESFFSSVITLEIDGNEEPVILKALQRHPAKSAARRRRAWRRRRGVNGRPVSGASGAPPCIENDRDFPAPAAATRPDADMPRAPARWCSAFRRVASARAGRARFASDPDRHDPALRRPRPRRLRRPRAAGA